MHDLGGMHGLGPVPREENEPLFHAPWERSVYAMSRVLTGTGVLGVDELRYGRERMDPVHYLAANYYERILYSLEQHLVAQGRVDSAELNARAEEFKRTQSGPPRTENEKLV
ncbi:MAG: nitrile hydratase subunit beta [Chloroflexi bacterium]|nr:nitrile hydratase subunit beta [Chloroflexota bacterium]